MENRSTDPIHGDFLHEPLTDVTIRAREQGIDKLLDRPLPEGYIEESTQRIAQIQEERRLNVRSAFIFRLGREWMALPSSCIREIVADAKPHSLPHRGGILLGLVSVRGELIICVSLSRLLEIEQSAARSETGSYTHLIVVTTEQGNLVFPVDEIHGVHRYYEDELRDVPSTLMEATALYTHAMLLWRQHTVGCLNDQILFYSVNKKLS